MRHDFWTLLGYARSRNLRVSIAPSVTPLLTRQTVERLVEAGVRMVSLSLDSPYEKEHDGMGVPSTWKRTLEAISWFQELGVRVYA